MSHLSNFLNETEHSIRMLDKMPGNIVYIGSANGEYCCKWEEFRAIADITYYRGGSDEITIAKDMVIIFNDLTTLYRTTDDYGLECWGTIEVMSRKSKGKPITNIKQLTKSKIGS